MLPTSRRARAGGLAVALVAALLLLSSSPATARQTAGGAVGRAAVAPPARVPAVPSCERSHDQDGPCTSRPYAPKGAARGVMIVIASGGWSSSPAGTAKGGYWEDVAHFWTALGWRAVVVENTSGVVDGVGGKGPDGLVDLTGWYARIRAQTPAKLPVCAFGQSSGGHYALMLAAVRPTLDCVVTEGAPTDLRALPGPAGEKAAAAFGDKDERWRYSPARLPKSTWGERRLLMGHLAGDQVVPVKQSTLLGKLPGLTTVRLASGRLCKASEIADEAEHHVFAHLCQQVGSTKPHQFDQASGTRWRKERVRLARELGVVRS